MTYKKTIRKDLIYPDLSYKIVGVLFDVFNELGPGYSERYYQKAVAEILSLIGIPYKKEVRIKINLQCNKEIICFIDFVIDGKIILEIKRGERFLKGNIEQVVSYLKATGLKLGIPGSTTSGCLPGSTTSNSQ